MRDQSFTFKASDGHELFVHRWLPDGSARAVIHIAHGMAEHGGRYARLAEALTQKGYAVYANDHRGHGKTAKTDDDLGHFGPEKPFENVVRDLTELIALEKKENPGLPVVLFGHSMGSFMVQKFLIDHGRMIQGAVLSGTNGKPNLLASAGRLVARLEQRRLGPRGRSKLIDALSVGQFNRRFGRTRTEFDWLSRDPSEVDKYIKDPRCGFICTTSLWVDLLDTLDVIARPENQAKIPKDVPLYIFSGTRDAVSDDTRNVEQLLAAYRRARIQSITHRFYPEGRHEMLNETNRDEVTRDLVTWLDRIVERAPRPQAAATATG
jgi:alpha-beta hydrolase superfamily lysophospholipase